MTVSSQLSSILSGSVSQNPLLKTAAATQASAATSTDASSGDAFGPAVTLDLSPSGQAAASSQSGDSSSDSSSPDSSGAPAPAGGGKGGGGAPVSTSTSTSQELADAIAAAKRKVAAQVGVVEANQLVDSQGNIDTLGLARAVAQQEQAKAATNSNGQ